MKKFTVLFLAFVLVGCRSTPFKNETLALKPSPPILEADPKFSKESQMLSEDLIKRYKEAKSPVFAFIQGYYRLPSVKPFGQATVVREFSYDSYFEAVSINQKEADYAIKPLSGDDALAFDKALNVLLRSGIKIKDVSMHDALAFAKAENNAAQTHSPLTFNKTLLPDVDYLVSLYPASSAKGNIMVGRVLKKDGSLVAFRVVHGSAHNVMSQLILELIKDTIERIS